MPIAIPQWTWTLTATSISVVTLNNLTPGFDFYYTTRPTGDTAPTAITEKIRPDDAVKVFRVQSTNKNAVNNQDEFVIESQVLIDVYTYSFSRDNTITTDGQLLVKNGQGNSITANPNTGGTDVNFQDQTTPPVEYFLSQFLNDVTIVGITAPKVNILNLSPGHGFLVDEVIEIYSEDTLTFPGITFKRFAQLVVRVVNVNAITVGNYVGFDLIPSQIVSSQRANINMAVNGTAAAPIRFSIGPPNGLKWHLTRAIGAMILTTNPDDGLFGNLSPLINGIFFGFESDITQDYLVSIIVNAGFRATGFDVNYTTRSTGGGSFGLAFRKSFNGPDKYGVVIELLGEENAEFVAYVADALAALPYFAIKLMGHVVQD